jgi:hypothetical protein
VFADLAAAVADGADCVDGVAQLWEDREQVFGPVASTATLWRLCDERIDATRLPGIRAARECAPAGLGRGAAPDHDGWLHMDVDAPRGTAAGLSSRCFDNRRRALILARLLGGFLLHSWNPRLHDLAQTRDEAMSNHVASQ